MTVRDSITALDTLIETCKDGEYGFRLCAQHAGNAPLKQLLARHAEDCSLAAAELQSMLRMLGASPRIGPGPVALRRGWISIEPVPAGAGSDDDRAVLAEAERGEDATLDAYLDALGIDLTPEVRAVVELQCEGARRNGEDLRALRMLNASS